MDPCPSADVVVVGGGLVGSSVAYELASRGASVTLLDASLPGRASDAGAGIVSPQTSADPDDLWFEFGLEAADHLRTLVTRLDDDGALVNADTFAECGSLVVALAEHEDRWFGEVLALASTRSPELTEIPREDARAMFPPLGPIWRAAHNPSAARLDGRGLCRSIREAASARGTALCSSPVLGIERRGDRVTGVVVPDSTVDCDALVVAAGAWSATVSTWLGVDLPLAPMKGQIVHVGLPDTSSSPGAPTPGGPSARADPPSERWPIVQPVLNFYLVPWPAGRVACGGTFEAEAGFDTRPTAGAILDLLRECVAIAPGLAGATFLEVRVGLRPVTPDDRPLLGPLPGFSNVHVCTGHGAHGLLLGPYSAALVASGVLGEHPRGLTPYAAARVCAP